MKGMNKRDYDIDKFLHNDEVCGFKYKPNSTKAKQSKKYTITIPIGIDNLFTLRTNEGYKNFVSRAPKYLRNFELFASASHVIPDDTSLDDKTFQPLCDQKHPGSAYKTREDVSQTRDYTNMNYTFTSISQNKVGSL